MHTVEPNETALQQKSGAKWLDGCEDGASDKLVTNPTALVGPEDSGPLITSILSWSRYSSTPFFNSWIPEA